MPSTEKLERLLNLTAALLETVRPLSAAEIAQRVYGYPDEKTAFRRTFERDKDDLREMGIPLVMSEIPGTDPPETGYRIPKDQYYLPAPGLEPDELAALHLAASTVRLDGIEGAGGLWKLGGRPSGPAPADTGPELTPLPVDSRLVVLFDAVAQRKPVTFTYHEVDRTVDPYRLDFQRDHWYVSGYDHLREDERNFRVDRIEGQVAAGTRHAFERPATGVPGARVEPWQLGEGEPLSARVLVDAQQAAIAVGEAGRGTLVEERGDGSVILELSVTNLDGFRSFVLGFLEHAEVLGPPELRADIIEWLQQL
ncbi:MAG: proteasome accessory factor [Acidimicrobiaceae bacterium]|jgi:predicted DNA-binding transcriptional regulator YafY